jgi:hypothetical protein
MEHATRNDVDAWLAGEPTVDFPMTKDELVATAERVGAPEPVLRAVRAVPLGTYQRRDEVVDAADTGPEAPPDSATQAARQRAGGPVAETERDVRPSPLHGERGIGA